jgi:hypothetical protein
MHVTLDLKTGEVSLMFGVEERALAKQAIANIIDRGKLEGCDVSGLCEALLGISVSDSTLH